MLTKNSANRTGAESQEHINLIAMMANHFKQKGYQNIKADMDGFLQPEPISDGKGNRYIPDLTCTKNDLLGTRIVLEAETCGTINDSHTAGQWTAFARAQGEFHVVVPKNCGLTSGREKAKARLRDLGITAQEIWTPQ